MSPPSAINHSSAIFVLDCRFWQWSNPSATRGAPSNLSPARRRPRPVARPTTTLALLRGFSRIRESRPARESDDRLPRRPPIFAIDAGWFRTNPRDHGLAEREVRAQPGQPRPLLRQRPCEGDATSSPARSATTEPEPTTNAPFTNARVRCRPPGPPPQPGATTSAPTSPSRATSTVRDYRGATRTMTRTTSRGARVASRCRAFHPSLAP